MQSNNNIPLLQNSTNNNPTKKLNTTTTTTSNNNNNKNNNNNNTSAHQRSQHHAGSSSSTTQACAACKYQRRKCAADCILAPYFPHDRQRQFLNAHRLFGVSNIVKIVRHLDPPAKDHAMRTIIFQSDARAADPVGGCYRIIRDLEHRIGLARAELDVVLHHLALCRAAHQAAAANEVAVVVDDVNSSWSTCMHGQINVNNNNNNNNNNNVHEESTTSSSFPRHMSELSMEDCDHHDQMKSILDHLSGADDDDAHEDHYNFDSHGNIINSCSNGILREENGGFKEDEGPFSYIQDHHDLKAVATFFTLTNCDI